jgi:hypothetical protein
MKGENGACADTSQSNAMSILIKLIKLIFTRENLLALLLCLILIAIIILSADLAPQWIYQGF